MFLEQNIKPENRFWKYIIGLFIIIIATLIGQIPLLMALGYKSLVNNESMPVNNEEILKYLEPNLSLFLILISFVFALLAVFFVVMNIHNQSLLNLTTARKKIDWNRIFFSFSMWGIFTIITTLISYVSNPENYILNFDLIPFTILFLIAVVMIPLQTSSEEYIFRAYLMQGFANLFKNKWMPLLLTSVTFGLLHIANPEVSKMGNTVLVYYIGTGLFLGIITLMDDGIELALGFHAANNLIGALLVTSDWSAFQTNSILKDVSEPTAGVDIVIPVFFVFPLLLLIFSKKYNWNNWSEKLTGKINVF